MNFTTLCTNIQSILYWVIAEVQHQIQQGIIGVSHILLWGLMSTYTAASR